MNTRAIRDREKLYKIIPIMIFVIFAVIFAFTFDINVLKEFLEKNEKLGLIICLFIYILLGVTLIPAEPVTLLILAWKGPLVAIIMATLGNTLTGTLEFAVGGNIGDLANFEAKKEKLPFHLGRLPIDSPAFLLLARMLPGFGSKFVSVASGVYQVPIRTFLWTTFVANLIGAAFIAFSGYGLINLFR